MNIVLIGFKSCGKSTVGRALAVQSGLEFTDTDTVLEDIFFRRFDLRYDCRRIYEEKGAECMRVLEAESLELLAGKDGYVIATGGGIILRPENILLLQKIGICVFLDVPLQVLEKRLAGNDSPLFAQKSVTEVYAQRIPLYKNAANMRYEAAPKEKPRQIAKKIYEEIIGKKNGQ